ncbi:hypothetical protein VNI00_008543 [Paramarasmius palmivorus]|uniref:Uncharacterized protein n=1 Tax=Paramarasmius palmivorus TaxID=297713 RepID=A0AAW0CX31_9AGAR
MAMGNLITKVAKDTGIHVSDDTTADNARSRFQTASMSVQVQVNRQQFTVKDDIELSETGRVSNHWTTGKDSLTVEDVPSAPSVNVELFLPKAEK